MKKALLIIALISFSCSSSNETQENSNNTIDNSNAGWLVPKDEVVDGGPGKDGIPSIDNPKFIDASSATFLSDDDLVVGIIVNNEIRAYPHKILDYHEIVNDEIEETPLTISYCPLTGTAFAWSSVSGNTRTTFGVSGLLYNANLILYDRNTDSYWSQLKLQCVNGELIGDLPILEPVVETTWKTWKTMFPSTQVLSLETGFSRDYSEYPYGPYKTNHDYFVFRAFPENESLPSKQRVFAIINDNKSKVYPFSNMSGGKVIKEAFNGTNYLIVGNNNIINAFELTTDELNLDFTYSPNGEVFFIDNEGTHWNIFGNAISGPKLGSTLKPTKSVASYWFAVAAFYPNPQIQN